MNHTAAEGWRQTVRETIFEWETNTAGADYNRQADVQAMWDLSAYVNAEFVPLMLELHRWPADRKLPRGVTRTEIGSIARNALCAWILDDTSFRSWHDADRPAVYLAVAELIRATSKVELKGLLWRALFWAIQNDCLCKPDAWAAWQGYILKDAEESRLKAERAAKRAAHKQAVGAPVFLGV